MMVVQVHEPSAVPHAAIVQLTLSPHRAPVVFASLPGTVFRSKSSISVGEYANCSMALTDLPFELLCAIVFDALSVHPRSSAVLCVNKAFYSIGQAHLHTYLSFRSAPQIATFGQDNTPLACIPRTLSVQLSGGTADFYTFDRLFAVFLRCQLRHVDSETAVDGLTPPLTLESLSFCLHSHTRNPRLHIIQAALALVE
jgi:hypothetical protein